MATITVPKPIGAIEVFPDIAYTSANIPAIADYVVCLRGNRITDSDGVNTPLRGLKITITHNETVATSPLPSVPYIWYEGTELKFDVDYSYKFDDRGIIGYGILVPV